MWNGLADIARTDHEHTKRHFGGIDGIRRLAAGVALTSIVLIIAAIFWSTQQSMRLLPDYRLGVDYRDSTGADATFDAKDKRIGLATLGGGIHTFHIPSGRFRQFTQGSTNGGLLADHVLSGSQDQLGQFYFLCQQDSINGLCRFDTAAEQWRTLFGMERFMALTAADPARITSVREYNGRLWMATDRAGIGVYDQRGHHWEKLHRAGESLLCHDSVREMLRTESDDLWIATTAGLNRVRHGEWVQIVPDDMTVTRDFQRIAWRDGRLWYVNAGAGGGYYANDQWTPVINESRWGNHGESDLQTVLYDAAQSGCGLLDETAVSEYMKIPNGNGVATRLHEAASSFMRLPSMV